MSRSGRRMSRLAAAALVLTLLFSGCAQGSAAVPEVRRGLEYAAEMDKNAVMSIEISAEPEIWQALLDNAADKQYISVDVTINGLTIENVGLRTKGNSSLVTVASDPNSDRYSLKLKFDEYVKGQTWLGLDMLVLNNGFMDISSMREYLSFDIMNSIGVDTPLYAYADIAVNGESWGFYLAIEDYDSGYLARTKSGRGELYKPTSIQPADGRAGFSSDDAVLLKYIGDELESYSSIFDNSKTRTDAADHTRIVAALKKLNEGAQLERYVDVDAVLRYLAAHTLVVNLDSYCGTTGHNYILYENAGQISILPWDYNMAFGGFLSGGATATANFPIDTPVSGAAMEDRPLISRLLEVPEYLERYHGYLQELLDSYDITARIEQTDRLISEYIASDPSAFYPLPVYKAALAELKKLCALRYESVQGQLDGGIPSTAQGQGESPELLVDASGVNEGLLGNMGKIGRG